MSASGALALSLRLGQARQDGMRVISSPASRSPFRNFATLEVERVSRPARPGPGTTRRPIRKSFQMMRSITAVRSRPRYGSRPTRRPVSRSARESRARPMAARAERDTGRRVGRLPYRGRLRTAVMERIIWNDFRIGLRVVPGPGRAGRETRSTSKVAKRRPAGRTADDAHAVLAGLAQAQREGQGSRS